MSDTRYTPKTLADCAAEFRAMMEDAIRQQNFETAATCKTFLQAIEKAAAENERLRGILREIADEDYRGNRSTAAIKAHVALTP